MAKKSRNQRRKEASKKACDKYAKTGQWTEQPKPAPARDLVFFDTFDPYVKPQSEGPVIEVIFGFALICMSILGLIALIWGKIVPEYDEPVCAPYFTFVEECTSYEEAERVENCCGGPSLK